MSTQTRKTSDVNGSANGSGSEDGGSSKNDSRGKKSTSSQHSGGNSGKRTGATLGDSTLSSLLEHAGLGAYAKRFAENQIDLDAFFLLRDEDLVSMQVPLGPRIKMKNLIDTRGGKTDLPVAPGTGTGTGTGNGNAGPGGLATGVTIIPVKDLVFYEDVGHGSFGAVFRGMWNGKVVAIKKLLTPAYEEATLLSHLRHRNVIQCFGCVTDSPSFCLVFEFAPYNLTQALHKYQVEPSVIVDWALQIATGMNYLHTEAPLVIIHRDLKPANVLMFLTEKTPRSPSGFCLKISDFGLSRIQMDENVEKLSTVGTWEYMAPEVIRNEPYTEKADVYSYGVVLWEMLTRQTPYKGLPSLAVAYGVGSGTMSLPIPSSCNVAVATLLERCWERSYVERPSFREIMRIMETISHSEFMNLSYGEFLELRRGWNSELVTTFESFKKETDVLKKREMVLSLAEMRLTERERKIQEREQQLTQSLSADLMCWHTLLRFTEDILGVGLSVTRGGPGARSPFQVTKVDVCDEYLSYTAFFKEKVRHSIKRDMVLDYWMPLYICADHGSRAMPLVEDAVVAIISGLPQVSRHSSKAQVKFEPRMAVAVFTTLLNNMVVGVVRENVHPFKALEMYMAFLRLLCDFIVRYPDLRTSCTSKVQRFIESEDRRHTSKVANLGEFLVVVGLTSINWDQMVDVFIDEVMQRSWFWILRYHPEFQSFSYDRDDGSITFRDVNRDEKIIEAAFDGAKRSLRIVMLHLYYLLHVARPPNMTTEQTNEQYDALFGQPNARMKDEFESACKEIMAVSTFQEFFRYVGLPNAPVTTVDLTQFLNRTASKAFRRGYYSHEQQAIELGYVLVG